MAIIKEYNGIKPQIAPSAFIAENAVIIGNVTIGENSSVWYNCVLRGDVNYIQVGNDTNIQDGTIIHVHRNDAATIIGNGVTIGHKCLLHGCTIQDYSFVGMGASIIDYAKLESESYVGACSLVTSNKIVKSHELWTGIPAKKMRMLTSEEIQYIYISRDNYVALAKQY